MEYHKSRIGLDSRTMPKWPILGLTQCCNKNLFHFLKLVAHGKLNEGSLLTLMCNLK
jgi:hypothetical protein